MSEERCNGHRAEWDLPVQQSRVLRALLDESVIPADPILDEGEALDSEGYLTICYELHHVLPPELADMRLVEFDRFEDEVKRGTRFDDSRPYLEQIEDDHDE